MKKALLVLIASAIALPVVLCACGSSTGGPPSDKRSEAGFDSVNMQETKQEKYDAYDLTETDMKAVAYTYLSDGPGKSIIEMIFDEEPRNCNVNSISKIKREEANGTKYVYFTAYGTFSVYDQYGSFKKTQKFEWNFYVHGTFSSSISEIANFHTYYTGYDFIYD